MRGRESGGRRAKVRAAVTPAASAARWRRATCAAPRRAHSALRPLGVCRVLDALTTIHIHRRPIVSGWRQWPSTMRFSGRGVWLPPFQYRKEWSSTAGVEKVGACSNVRLKRWLPPTRPRSVVRRCESRLFRITRQMKRFLQARPRPRICWRRRRRWTASRAAWRQHSRGRQSRNSCRQSWDRCRSGRSTALKRFASCCGASGRRRDSTRRPHDGNQISDTRSQLSRPRVIPHLTLRRRSSYGAKLEWWRRTV